MSAVAYSAKGAFTRSTSCYLERHASSTASVQAFYVKVAFGHSCPSAKAPTVPEKLELQCK
jgi:hypothetical protein